MVRDLLLVGAHAVSATGLVSLKVALILQIAICLAYILLRHTRCKAKRSVILFRSFEAWIYSAFLLVTVSSIYAYKQQG